MIKYSSRYKNIQKRFNQIPKMTKDVILGFYKKKASEIVRTFRNGIQKDNLGLERLNPMTIKQKIKMKYEAPETPLLGKGGSDERAYKNMMIIRESKNKVTIRPSRKKHHKAKLSLKKLLIIHEYGSVHKGRGNSIIRIPARPALLRSYERVMSAKADKINTQEYKKAIMSFVNTENAQSLKRIADKFLLDLEKIER